MKKLKAILLRRYKRRVADDQLVLLSEGELVVPANVVRYHGLGTYEGMRREALMGHGTWRAMARLST